MVHSKAVVDTNVLYAGLYSATGASHQILRRIEEHQLIPVLSTALLFEYEEILNRNSKTLGLSVTDIEDVLDGFCARSDNRRIHFLWRPKLRDIKDDHILELAVAAGGVDIITHNTKDFEPAHTFDICVLTPAAYLKERTL